MPNTLLTPDIIAREALMVLRNNAVMANLVHRDYSTEFAAVGDTITVRKPAKFTAKEYNGSTIDVQDATESSVTVKMDKHLDVSFAVTSKQLTLNIKDFSAQLLVPAMQAFADKVDGYLLGLAADIDHRVQHTANAISSADIVDARKFLTNSAVPLTERRFVIGADAEADLLKETKFIEADKLGDNGTALREASLGRKYGFDIYVDQNAGSYDSGSTVSTTALKISSTVSGATTIGLSATTVTGKIAKGTWLKIGNDFYQVTEDATANTNAFSAVKVNKKVTATKDDDVTVLATSKPSLAFHKNAFALVTRPLALPKGAANTAVVNYDGFALRVVYGYDMNTKTDTVSIDMLCGVKTLDAKLAAVIDDVR